MLHANLKAVFSPQIASMCGAGGDTGVHCCAHIGILEELLSVFDNQVVWFECCCQHCVMVFVSFSYNLWRETLSFVSQKCPMLSF